MSNVRILDRAFKVDLAINHASKSFVIIRFLDACHAYYWKIDEWIARYSRIVSFFSEIYMVEKKDVPEHVARYGLSDPDSILFFYKGSAIHRLPTADILYRIECQKDFFDTAYEIMSRELQHARR